MNEQAECWSRIAPAYEHEFIDPYRADVRSPLHAALERLAGPSSATAADLGCGVGPLLPFLASRFHRVVAVDFAEGMLGRARERCGRLANVHFMRQSLTDLAPLAGQVDVAVAVNSLIMPAVPELEACLAQVRACLKPGGKFLGIVPAIDAVHYYTMLMLDRALARGLLQPQAKQNAAHHAEHELYDFGFGEFRYKGLEQHFWQPFEVRYRLRRAGFRTVRLARVALSWEQFRGGKELKKHPPPWDWFFAAGVSGS